ncbi:tRNA lysidine(34) synthetase TilS [Natribacillus halophilus]|uniref:tRNA(Ile)-lysidine synthase n=1 Tax=Natribacillus halophilus TaxID=549003 RepID=A0A1G8RHR8_9BACI|nr:tRNA lysidine(34) synthetase TilS [Natribacillus halophilus]SDJ16536.1 tRNA(Ile)-lysidine synthase [Natribacillus halophilus]
MKHKIETFASRHEMFPPGTAVLVAVSGGVDSMALLHYLHSNRHVYGVTVMAVHCNHGLRVDAFADEKLVEQFCRENDIPFFYKKLDLPSSRSIQRVSREMRYEFFSEIMASENVDRLATAHHGDDQVETILMQQMRGINYYGGQIGIAAHRPFGLGKLVRPLLALTKAELIAYARAYSVPWREDTSNEKDDYTRNRVRNHLLPTLKRENREVHAHFQTFAEDVRDDAIYLHEQAEKIISETTEKQPDGYKLEITPFRQYPIPLQRRAIHLLLNYLYEQKHTQFSRVHIDECLALMASRYPSAERSFPEGVYARRNYGQLHLANHKGAKGTERDEWPKALYEFPAKVDSEMGSLCFKHVKERVPHDEATYCCPLATLSLPLLVRTRLPGDVIRPLGLGGTQKLKQVMIDAKVPRPERSRWPVVTDAKGTVLWVPLLKKNEDAGRHARDGEYLLITFKGV